MYLWDSIVRVMWDPDGAALVLVDYGDPMWEPVSVDGQQSVQAIAAVRASGAKHLPRGNESHLLSFTLARIEAGVSDAFVARLAAGVSLPKSASKPVLLSFESGEQFRLSDCAVRAWPHSQEEHVTRESVVIDGGRLTVDAGMYVPGTTWGEISFNWEDLG
jgi:hypothetical protein